MLAVGVATTDGWLLYVLEGMIALLVDEGIYVADRRKRYCNGLYRPAPTTDKPSGPPFTHTLRNTHSDATATN